MDQMREYFLCPDCNNREFKRIYTFSFLFHGVNFSDNLIYDKLVNEIYQCIKCQKTFTKDQIEKRLAEFKQKRK